MKVKYAKGAWETDCEVECFSVIELWINCHDSEAISLGGLSHASGPREAEERSVGARTLEWDSGDLALLLKPRGHVSSQRLEF